METEELKQLAERTRFMREAGIALLAASGLLGLFLLVPMPQRAASETETALASAKTSPAFTDVPVEAKAAIVYDLATGNTLYAKNADAQLPLASLTKLLTVYAALKELPPESLVTIPRTATTLDAPRIFKAGQRLSLSDLARLTLTASLNDGAAAIAEAAAVRSNRSESVLLASAAASLSLSQTYAMNGSGLDVNEAVSGGYGSARDLARLSGAFAQELPYIAEATTLPYAEASSADGASFTVKNTDPIISSVPHILLSKTGFTDLAGGNLSLVFDVGIGHPIAVVVLGSSKEARFTDGAALVAATLAHFAGVPSL
ncbi:D-alanyl-D-alanine carboxypeptidase [Candidatus Kaiserbacteria bacterium]|nr:D-alanyl-D-alanine carboxypeptidase [Candidatus Kaiserbacteria bacterium]